MPKNNTSKKRKIVQTPVAEFVDIFTTVYLYDILLAIQFTGQVLRATQHHLQLVLELTHVLFRIEVPSYCSWSFNVAVELNWGGFYFCEMDT